MLYYRYIYLNICTWFSFLLKQVQLYTPQSLKNEHWIDKTMKRINFGSSTWGFDRLGDYKSYVSLKIRSDYEPLWTIIHLRLIISFTTIRTHKNILLALQMIGVYIAICIHLHCSPRLNMRRFEREDGETWESHQQVAHEKGGMQL